MHKHSTKILQGILLLIFASTPALAVEESVKNVWADPLTYIIISTVLLILMSALAIWRSEKITASEKKIYFWIITAPAILASAYLGIHTIYENVTSATGGPVHWHFDYDVYNCNFEKGLDLVDPKFPSNKVGSPLLHEHNDNRAHVEGTVMNLQEINLGNYLRTTGANVYSDGIDYPTQDRGVVSMRNGQACPDGQSGTFKVFVNGKRMVDYEHYVMSHYTLVPPGDCIILEFSPGDAQTTDKLCTSWQVAGWNYENQNEKRGVSNHG